LERLIKAYLGRLLMEAGVLENLGLSHNESKVYLTLLKLGLSTAGEVAKESKIHRTNTYDALERLVEKGLVSFIIKDKIKYFEACSPDFLLSHFKEKERALEDALPQLRLSAKLGAKKGEAHVFEGVKAFFNILYHWLDFNSDILVYGIPKDVVEQYLKFQINHFHKERQARKVVMKHIYNHNAKERIRFLNKTPYTEAKYLPQKYDTEVSTCVCGDEVALIMWIDPPMIIHICSKRLANAYHAYFELLWEQAKV
jgi:HTH-type transcriptional regulator, sugar sensing transcriptional regulator